MRQEAAEAQSAARERQKKFSVLNATFRKKEEGLLARVEEAESADSQLRAEAAAAQHHATLAQQVGTSLTDPSLALSGSCGTHLGTSSDLCLLTTAC